MGKNRSGSATTTDVDRVPNVTRVVLVESLSGVLSILVMDRRDAFRESLERRNVSLATDLLHDLEDQSTVRTILSFEELIPLEDARDAVGIFFAYRFLDSD